MDWYKEEVLMTEEKKKELRDLQKQKRKEAYQKFKESDAYKAHKEQQKTMRKQTAERMKQRRKEKIEQMKAKVAETKLKEKLSQDEFILGSLKTAAEMVDEILPSGQPQKRPKLRIIPGDKK